MKQNYLSPIFTLLILPLILLSTLNSCKDNDIKTTSEDDEPASGVTTVSGAYTWGNVAIGGGGFTTGFIFNSNKEDLLYMRTDVGGAYRWIESTKTWKPITDFVGSEERSLLGIESIATDPSNPEKLYIAAGTEYWNNGLSCILISDDYGETFQKTIVTSQMRFHGNGMGRSNGERLQVDPNKSNILFCGTRKDGLFKSTDYGATWAKIISFPATTTENQNGICFVMFDESTGTKGSATQTIYVGLSRKNNTNLYQSTNGGGTWEAVKGATEAYMPQRCLLANGKLYVTYADAEGPWNPKLGSIKKFTINTQTWEDITPLAGTPYGGISTNKDNSFLLASTKNHWIDQGNNSWGDEIYISTNDGNSWTALFQNAGASKTTGGIGWVKDLSIHWAGDIKIDPNNKNRAFVISGNGVFMTENLTSPSPEWQFTSKGIEETVPLDLVSIPDGPLVSVIADYDGFAHYDITKYPETRHSPSIGTSTGVAYAGQKPNFVVRAGDDKDRAIYYSEDYGKTWSRVNTSNLNYSQGTVAVSSDGECIVWSVEQKVYRTTDLGQTWTECQNISGSPKVIADLVKPDLFYAFNGSELYISGNKAESFTKITTEFTGGSGLIRAVPGNEGHVLFPTSGGLYITKDFCSTFEKIETVEYCEAVGTGKGPEGSDYPSIYIYGSTISSSERGAYRSDDIGQTWVRINDENTQFGGLANGEFIIGDQNVFGRVYMSTAGRGIVYGEKN